MTFEAITHLLKHPAQPRTSGDESILSSTTQVETPDQTTQTANDRRERRIKLAELTNPKN